MRKYLFSAGLALLAMAVSMPAVLAPQPALASQVKYIVNGVPITSDDIAHRAAFLRLQHKKGGDAANEMIEQTLRLAEARRLGIRISADTPEALQAWRRAIGLEAPDPAADAKWRNQAARQPGADAARERRRRRTLELIPRDGVAAGTGEAECLPLPAVSDPCTRVVSYDPQVRIISVTER